MLAHRGHTFDPYPYILLNLFLAMLAANLLRETQWSELLKMQQEQLGLLNAIGQPSR